jgi:uncharacterized delta-60 repeat protein
MPRTFPSSLRRRNHLAFALIIIAVASCLAWPNQYLSLLLPSASATITSSSEKNVTYSAVASPGAISFAAGTFSVKEGDGFANITLTRTGGSDNQVVAKVSLTNVSTSAADYFIAPGAIDKSFNPGAGPNSGVWTTALQSDGKVIIGGEFTAYNGTARRAVARLNADGSLDTSFNPGTGVYGVVKAIAVQADGKIIIGGDIETHNRTLRPYVTRLNSDGSLDASFNPGSGASGIVHTVALQADGKIIIGGDFSSYNGTYRLGIARLNSDGSLDTSFNSESGAQGGVSAVTVQPDGKIVIGGYFEMYGGTFISHIARLNSDATLDTSFNPGSGPGGFGANTIVRSIWLQTDGKVVIGGEFSNFNGAARNSVARLNFDGSLDTSFIPNMSSYSLVRAVSVQADGKILVGGYINKGIIRLNSGGSLDTSFNADTGGLRSIVIQPDGQIVIAGDNNYIARVKGDLFVTWPAGDTLDKVVKIPIINDSILEPDENLTLSVSPLVGGATVGVNPSATLTIVDNDNNISKVSGSGVYNGTATLTATLAAFNSNPSGKTLSFSLNNTPVGTATTDSNGVATLSNVSLSGIKAGSYPGYIKASFAGDAIFASSTNTGGLTVSKAIATFSLSNLTQIYDGVPKSATITTNAPAGALTVTYNGSLIVPTNAGTYQMVATVNDANYNGQATGTLTINKANQTITFGAISAKTFGNSDFTVAPVASSGLSVAISVTGQCTVSGNNIGITGAGSCTVTASQAGNSNFNPASSVSRTFSIATATATVTLGNLSQTYNGVSRSAQVTTSPFGLSVTVTYSQDGSPVSSPINVGSYNVVAKINNPNYQGSASGVLVINKATPVIFWNTPPSIIVGTPLSSEQLNATANVTGTFQYNPSAGTVLTLGTSQLSVTFTPADTANYTTATNSMLLTVDPIPPPALGLTSTTYNVNEGAGQLHVNVARSGDSSIPVKVNFSTSDTAGSFSCNAINGIASSSCDYLARAGTLQFAAGETFKTISIPIVDDAIVEADERLSITLSDPTGASLGSPTIALITITDNEVTPSTANPIDENNFFIRQHYLDFLDREPEAEGFTYWTTILNGCGTDEACLNRVRVEISSRFFIELEFQRTGFYVMRIYQASYGHPPTYPQFISDRRLVQNSTESQKLFASQWVQRADFLASYPTALSAAEFVKKLYDQANVPDLAPRAAAQQALENQTKTRADVLYDLVELAGFQAKEYNPAFVRMMYFGYLRREVEADGFTYWMNVLTNLSPNNYRSMICGFVNAGEYQLRFNSTRGKFTELNCIW